MSIEKMIAEHPDVVAGGDYNEALGRAVKHAMYCAALCNSCADACLAEAMDMHQCIRLCLDCSDVCQATYRVATRRTGGNRELIRTMLAACIRACELCEAECARHDHAHCRVARRCAANAPTTAGRRSKPSTRKLTPTREGDDDGRTFRQAAR